MIRTTITETTEKYDKDGNLVEKTTMEKTTENTEYEYPCHAVPGPMPRYQAEGYPCKEAESLYAKPLQSESYAEGVVRVENNIQMGKSTH